jgi:4-amino-4-deoxy-L-arabinose transferase-like glycosyltransferase
VLQQRSSVFAPTGAPAARAGALALAAALGLICLGASMVLAVGIVKRFDPFSLPLLALWLGAMALLVRQAAANRIDWRLLAFILLFSLALRWWSAVLTFGVALGADPMNYTNLATAVLEGRGLVTDDWFYGPDLRAYFPPFYPLARAGFWALFGASAYSTLAMNSLIDAAAAWCLADAGKRMGQEQAGRAAAIAYFAWPAFALSAGIPQKESLTLLFLLLLLRGVASWLTDPDAERRRWRHALPLGAWWGLLALTQPSLALAPAAVGLVLLWQKGFGPVFRLGLAALPALIAVLLPWWVMVNSALVNLRVPFPPGIFELSEPERSALMGELARQAIRDDPLGFLGEALRSQMVGFAAEEAPLARFRHTDPPISAADHARLAPLLQGAYAALLGSAAAAAWRQFRLRQVDPLLLYALVLLVSIGATNIWFEFGERHRLAMTPLMLLLAASWWLNARRPAPR